MNMNATSQDTLYLEDNHTRESDESATAGDIVATIIMVTYTAAALIISGWSAILLKFGNIENGGPIGLLFHALRVSGLV